MQTGRLLILPALAICAPAQALEYLSVEAAQKLMFGTEPLTAEDRFLTPEQAAAIEQAAGVKVTSRHLQAWRAADGWFLVDAVIGKHDLIRYAVALGNDGAVRQVEILEYREAYGSEVRNPRWRAQFTGKKPGDTVQIGEGIQNISGATLSCQHVTDGIRRLLATYAVALKPIA